MNFDFLTQSQDYIKQTIFGCDEISVFENEIKITTNKDSLIDLIKQIKDDPNILANCLIAIFGTHFPQNEKEFLIEYLFLSYKNNKRFRILIEVDIHEKLDSISEIFPGSVWYEREIFDMLGVQFNNLQDHRRILTDYNVTYHPLRKDFPVTGFDEVKYNPISQKVEYFKSNLAQEYRNFDNNMVLDNESVFDKVKNAK